MFAAPALAVKAVEHCFPVAGWVAYQGYYSLAEAQAAAARLQAEGLDTFVVGALAYSTLGHVDDLMVSPLLRYDDARREATYLHQRAPQRGERKARTAVNG